MKRYQFNECDEALAEGRAWLQKQARKEPVVKKGVFGASTLRASSMSRRELASALEGLAERENASWEDIDKSPAARWVYGFLEPYVLEWTPGLAIQKSVGLEWTPLIADLKERLLQENFEVMPRSIFMEMAYAKQKNCALCSLKRSCTYAYGKEHKIGRLCFYRFRVVEVALSLLAYAAFSDKGLVPSVLADRLYRLSSLVSKLHNAIERSYVGPDVTQDLYQELEGLLSTQEFTYSLEDEEDEEEEEDLASFSEDEIPIPARSARGDRNEPPRASITFAKDTIASIVWENDSLTVHFK